MSDRRSDWGDLPSDPSPNCDLGYRLLELDLIECGGDRFVMLPTEEEMTHSDAFLLVGADDVCGLSDWR